MMSKPRLKLVALLTAVGSVAMAAAAGAMMPKPMVNWTIIVVTCLVWISSFVVGRTFGAAPGWSLWALGTALGAAVATTGLIPFQSLIFVGAALLVSVAAILSGKSVSDAIDALHDQH